jgi:hypothetical protein
LLKSPNPYGIVPAFLRLLLLSLPSLAISRADVAILATKYPQVVQFDGTPNSFVGVNPGDITGGIFNAQTLLQGDNLGWKDLGLTYQVQVSVWSCLVLLEGVEGGSKGHPLSILLTYDYATKISLFSIVAFNKPHNFA